jgi:methionine aminopeptidase
VIGKLIPECVAGKRVVELCTLGDQLIDAGVAGIYNNPKRKVESKGVAFPTSISINNIVGHYSPLKDDTLALKDGDVVKMYDRSISIASCALPRHLAQYLALARVIETNP